MDVMKTGWPFMVVLTLAVIMAIVIGELREDPHAPFPDLKNGGTYEVVTNDGTVHRCWVWTPNAQTGLKQTLFADMEDPTLVYLREDVAQWWPIIEVAGDWKYAFPVDDRIYGTGTVATE